MRCFFAILSVDIYSSQIRENSGDKMPPRKHQSADAKSVITKSDSMQVVTQDIELSDREQRFLLAQYDALREEILKRLDIQHQLILGALVALGTVLTVSTQRGSSAVLLMYPYLSLFLTLAWSQND